MTVGIPPGKTLLPEFCRRAWLAAVLLWRIFFAGKAQGFPRSRCQSPPPPPSPRHLSASWGGSSGGEARSVDESRSWFTWDHDCPLNIGPAGVRVQSVPTNYSRSRPVMSVLLDDRWHQITHSYVLSISTFRFTLDSKNAIHLRGKYQHQINSSVAVLRKRKFWIRSCLHHRWARVSRSRDIKKFKECHTMSHMNGGVRGVEGGVRAEGEMDAVLLGRTKNLKVIYLLLQPLSPLSC